MSTEIPPARRRWQKIKTAMRAAFGIIVEYPVLIPLGIITLLVEISYSGINNVTIPKYIPALGVPASREGRVIATVTGAFLLSEAFLRIPFGWLSDRFGRAKVIIAALFLSVPTILLSGFVPSYQWLYPLRWWDGMMAAAIWPSVYAIIGDAVPQRLRANAMGVVNMMYMLALFGGWAVGAGVLTLTNNPRLFFFVAAGIFVVGALISLAFFLARPQLGAPHPEVHIEDAERAVASVGRHIVLLTITFTQNFAISILAPFMYRYATDPPPGGLGFSLGQLAFLVGVPVVGVGALAIPLSRLSDVIGKLAAVRIAFGAIAIMLWVFSFRHTLIELAVTGAVIGVAFAMGIPAWLAILSSLTGAKTRGVTLAGYGTVQGLAAVMGPLAAGWIWDEVGHPQIFMASAAAVTLAALLAFFALPERTPRSNKPLETV